MLDGFGVNINLMPLPMMKNIDNLESRPTRMTLQLADKSIKYHMGGGRCAGKVGEFIFWLTLS